jgi:hypothetical protein
MQNEHVFTERQSTDPEVDDGRERTAPTGAEILTFAWILAPQPAFEWMPASRQR